MARCCYYERGNQTKTICTCDKECPVLTGWTLVGSWEVGDCDDCFGSAGTPTISDGGVSISAGEIAAVRFPAPLFMSQETYAAMEHLVAKRAPQGCHLEVVFEPNGAVTYRCVGKCEDKREICALCFDKKPNGDLVITCDCK